YLEYHFKLIGPFEQHVPQLIFYPIWCFQVIQPDSNSLFWGWQILTINTEFALPFLDRQGMTVHMNIPIERNLPSINLVFDCTIHPDLFCRLTMYVHLPERSEGRMNAFV